MSTATDRHLALLDELAETAMVLTRRLRDLPPLPGQDCARDFDILARALRRSILLYHLLKNDQLPIPKSTLDRSGAFAPTASAPTGDFRTRLDPVDRLDDVSGPFEQVVASIVRDIQTALATSHFPLDQAPLIQDIVRRSLPIRLEADTADPE